MKSSMDVIDFTRALERNDLVGVAYYIEKGGNVNEYWDDWPPIMHFVSEPEIEGYDAFELLLESSKDIGLDINRRAEFGNKWNVLILASVNDSRNSSLELLLKYAKETGLNVNYKGYVRNGDTDDDAGGKTGLMLAIKYGCIENIKTYIKYMEQVGIKITRKEIDYSLTFYSFLSSRKNEVIEVCKDIKWTK